MRTLACIALAWSSLVCSARAQAPEIVEFSCSFDAPDRVWIGPGFWANRLQDWRLEDGRAVCVRGEANLPVRTLHVLTHEVAPGDGVVSASVQLGRAEHDKPASADAWAGFLIGAGGEHVDPRLTAFVHHSPAPDGGMLGVVDGTGRVAFRDFSAGTTGGNQWAVSGPLAEGAAGVIAQGDVPQGGAEAIELTLAIEVRDGRARCVLASFEAGTRRALSQVFVDDVDAAMVDGGIALVSHRGAEDGQRGHWFDDFGVLGSLVRERPDAAFGPVLFAQYTLSGGVLKLTAQLAPVGIAETPAAALELRQGDGSWVEAARAPIDPDARTATFRVDGYEAGDDAAYRVGVVLDDVAGKRRTHFYKGTIRREPVDGREFVIASLNCQKTFTGSLQWNSNSVWFPHRAIVDGVEAQDPDLLFFAGDQIYESDLTPAVRQPQDDAILDYLYKYYRWGWAFGELTRNRPTVTIPDDHDVYHGNIWGAGGKRAARVGGLTAQDSGGYVMPARFVNMVHRTQTSHLPDPADPAPIGQGINPYHTTMLYGGVSFAVLADRMYKSSPALAAPEAEFRNGWPQNPGFTPEMADVDATLLGDDQLRMLHAWATDWTGGAWYKVCLSQTPFTNVATIPRDAMSGSVLPSLGFPEPGEYPMDEKLAADADSNAWPKQGRDRAVRELRRGFAIHLAGDQHLSSLVQYGVDEFRDGSIAFCSPAIANTWPRRFFPPEPGAGIEAGEPVYTGDFFDGFGNRMTVYAVGNPRRSHVEPTALHDRMPGFGIVRLNRETREATFECWPRMAPPGAPDLMQYEGWPHTFMQTENGRGELRYFLPSLQLSRPGMIVQVIDPSGEVEYAVRLPGAVFHPWTRAAGEYTVRVGDPGVAAWREFKLESREGADERLLTVLLRPDR